MSRGLPLEYGAFISASCSCQLLPSCMQDWAAVLFSCCRLCQLYPPSLDTLYLHCVHILLLLYFPATLPALHTYRLDLLLERTASSVGVTADLASLTVWLACTPVALYYFVFAVCNRFSPRVSESWPHA